MSGIVVTASTNPVYSASVQKGAGALGGGAVGAGAIGGSGAAGGGACGGDTRMVMLVSSMCRGLLLPEVYLGGGSRGNGRAILKGGKHRTSFLDRKKIER